MEMATPPITDKTMHYCWNIGNEFWRPHDVGENYIASYDVAKVTCQSCRAYIEAKGAGKLQTVAPPVLHGVVF